MCGITGWVDWEKNLKQYPSIIERMTQSLSHRGPDAEGKWLSHHCALGHRRLAVIDPHHGAQPMWRNRGNETYVIVYNGELYNACEIKKELEQLNVIFQTNCDTEVLLCAFMQWGISCLDKLNGIFAFAIWLEQEQTLWLGRDRLGVKPLFYAVCDSMFLFGSEPKAILAHADFQRAIDANGFAEMIVMGPARTPGNGVFQQMHELKPGHYVMHSRKKQFERSYWKLSSQTHEDSIFATTDKIQFLLSDSLHRQLRSDVPLCTFLSGGLDSSILTTLAAHAFANHPSQLLHTFSLDFTDNDLYFKSNAYQPNSDEPSVQIMVDYLKTQHNTVQIELDELVNSLRSSLTARDMPGMADVDGSLYLFCREIKKHAKVAISGEASDEIFGGYPWFYQCESSPQRTFPWSSQLDLRMSVFKPEIIDWINPDTYMQARYDEACAEVPHLSGETLEQQQMRTMSYLNITRFMPTLLDRKDRMSMAVGLEVRVPFCDHRLVEYVWNIPWEFKTLHQREKGILREAFKSMIPEEILYRKKSPYPKTHNPAYLQAVSSWLQEILHDASSPILHFVDKTKLLHWLNHSSATPDFRWFGQLMTLPQFFAYLIQVNEWLRIYSISIR
jgi:asparagine synthase (glutamine-hydrolysing)